MSAKFVKTLLSIQTIPQGYVPSPGSIRVFSSANKKSLLKKSRLLWFRLSYANVSSAHSAAVFRISFCIKCYRLTFFKSFEAVAYDSGKMYKYIFAAVSRSNETKAFIRVKPFYSTVHHNEYLLNFIIFTDHTQKTHIFL